jgi:hypothetical protein
LKGNVMRDRAGGRSAAKWAGLKIGVGSAVVVRPGVFRGSGVMVRGRHSDGTQFQGERDAAGRHEAGGHIGAKQKQGQQPEAGRVSAPKVKGGLRHQEPASNTQATAGTGISGRNIMTNPPFHRPMAIFVGQ